MISKKWYLQIMEYYSTREGIGMNIVYATIWVKLRNILSERNQIQKAIGGLINLFEMSSIDKSIKTKG